MHVRICTHICGLSYQVGVEVVGVEEEGVGAGRLENLVHRVSWAWELG